MKTIVDITNEGRKINNKIKAFANDFGFKNIDTYLNMIKSGEKSVIDALYELSNSEIKSKQEKAILACVKVANFPFLKELDDFDFEFQPSINKQEILDLKSLRFVENSENILFIGTPGVGKTHLATAIGI